MLDRKHLAGAAVALVTASGLVTVAPSSAVEPVTTPPPGSSLATETIAYTVRPVGDGPGVTTYITPHGGPAVQPTLPDAGSLYPRLSPDGRRLVAGVFTSHGLEAAVMHPDGSHLRMVPVPGLSGEELEVSPCSWLTRRILLCSVRTLPGDIDGIYRVDLTGRHAPLRLTTNPYPRQDGFGGGDVIGDIAPDGRRLVFMRARPTPPAGDPDADQSGALYLVRTDGSHLRRITAWGVPNSHDNGVESWGDAGRGIVFGTENGHITTITPGGDRDQPRLGIPSKSYAFAPSWAPHGRRIVFGLYPAPDYQPDLYTASLPTGRLRQLTDSGETDDTPDWGVLRAGLPAHGDASGPTLDRRRGSPDVHVGGRLYFTKTSPGDVQTIYAATGAREKALTTPGEYCCVLRVSSADRRLLVFPTADQPPPLAGGTLDLRGQHFLRLTPRDPTLNLIPTAWSPDGTRIAYVGWDDGDPSRRGLYTTRADGRGLTRVTTRPGDLDDVPLDYSPNGRRLVFYRSAHPDPDPHTDGALWVVGVDGSGAHPITGGKTPPADWARWSPDGRRIVFAAERTSPTGALWTVAPDGTHLTPLYEGSVERFPISPVWSPDGRRILYALDPGNDPFTHPDNTLWTIPADGGLAQLVDDSRGFKSQLDWVSRSQSERS